MTLKLTQYKTIDLHVVEDPKGWLTIAFASGHTPSLGIGESKSKTRAAALAKASAFARKWSTDGTANIVIIVENFKDYVGMYHNGKKVSRSTKRSNKGRY